MASTTAQPVRIDSSATTNPLARWHLLSLDAPTVATLWMWFVARSNSIHLPVITAIAMFCAVWALYAADRLLDARTVHREFSASSRKLPALEARHVFHHSHRSRFAPIIVGALVVLATLLPGLKPAALRLFSIEGLLLAAWFIVLHATSLARHLPKELALGPFFAAAVYIPTFARLPASAASRLVPGAILFAALCSLNCLFIYRWETTLSSETAHRSTRLAARHVTLFATALMVAGLACALLQHQHCGAVPAASALSGVILLVLDRTRARFHRTTLRAAADFALLTPLLLLPFAR